MDAAEPPRKRSRWETDDDDEERRATEQTKRERTLREKARISVKPIKGQKSDMPTTNDAQTQTAESTKRKRVDRRLLHPTLTGLVLLVQLRLPLY